MRLVTRGDLDGLTSAVLITSVEDISEIELIHPQDITDGHFVITDNDIMANLPYHPACAVWFDHHELTESNARPPEGFKGAHALKPSVARVIYNYYGPERLEKFKHLVDETDRFDSAQLSLEDVTDPQGVIMLGFTIDPRTGMGRFKEYFLKLVEWLKTRSIDEVMTHPEVVARIERYHEDNSAFRQALKANSRQDGNVVVTDFRKMEHIPVGNRFLIYTLFPDANVSVRLQLGPKKKFVAATIGHSIFNRTCKTDIGQLCSDFGGGGHRGAGACILPTDEADSKAKEIVKRLKEKA
jgi:hypothetical protein